MTTEMFISAEHGHTSVKHDDISMTSLAHGAEATVSKSQLKVNAPVRYQSIK